MKVTIKKMIYLEGKVEIEVEVDGFVYDSNYELSRILTGTTDEGTDGIF